MLLKYLPSNLLIIFKSTSIRTLVFSLLIIGLILVFLLDLALGSVSIPIQEVINILLGQEPEKATWANIILKFRLPKALTATLAGAALGVSGLQMQTLFKNPLAGPFVLGISSGASLGVALVVLTASLTTPTLLNDLGIITDFGLVIAASLGAAAVLGLMLVVARRVQETMTLLILGLLFGYATSAIVSILLQFSSKERIQSYIMWTFGSFAGVTWKQLIVLIPVIVCSLLVAVLQSKSLNALLLGEAYARSVGLTVEKARFSIISSASILAGGITAFCGPIAFLGVAIPHLCRSLFMSSDHRILIPGVMIMGGILALVADLFSQLWVSQMVLPLNAITALIGTPVVTWVILRRNSQKSFPS
ncbi:MULTISPECIES: FecCD family ABC transporter permease [unclassified Tolypothrix]|uniref:FecCD family ABC transporter permease n=1 Tax=unclassified Tolypothrix TaxID=2649714 RepID=UPI0005EAA93F|nr:MULTISPECIES: iron ABC transporter permease [unclassified Tolypothrix]BAY90441.1 transport system permease protein [Microchaete diplosiphon NIES-3275]EKF01017.1 iron chelate uptake ABC transporter, FeCT family, permease protein [Tolypothrix sp. PCC 7601]MBE9085291.1 iron ABC transporter permease [Tolypothrix sp. LEGE 11397]UYD24610.1 iron ABC transporter permease [Tolypothrix sp. PCC 7712]UYD33160.1 iron ABC transporter permease [Tolypothrix sp. PCC 7601]